MLEKKLVSPNVEDGTRNEVLRIKGSGSDSDSVEMDLGGVFSQGLL